MKYLLLIPVLACAAPSCSTVGSFDSARLNQQQSAIVADSMTAELRRYPQATVVPSGKPLFDAFADDLEAKGWDLHRSDRFEFRGSNWQKNYLRIIASKASGSGVVVSMKTPYFDVHQGFEIDATGGIYPVTTPTLHLKNYVER